MIPPLYQLSYTARISFPTANPYALHDLPTTLRVVPGRRIGSRCALYRHALRSLRSLGPPCPPLYQLSYTARKGAGPVPNNFGIRTRTWLRGADSNGRPPGYEPDELPDCSTPRVVEEYSENWLGVNALELLGADCKSRHKKGAFYFFLGIMHVYRHTYREAP
jgi:hypothetical protein